MPGQTFLNLMTWDLDGLEIKSLSNPYDYEVTSELTTYDSYESSIVLGEDVSYSLELISNPANFARSAIFQINKELGNNLTDISISGDYSSDFNETTWNNNWSVNQGYKPTYQELMTKITVYTDALTLTDNIIEFEEGPIESEVQAINGVEGFEIILNDAQGSQVFILLIIMELGVFANDHRPEIEGPHQVSLAIDEYSPSNTLIYDADATDADGNATLVYSLSGNDASYFDINVNTGEVTLLTSPDFEIKSSYDFDVIVSDGKYTILNQLH